LQNIRTVQCDHAFANFAETRQRGHTFEAYNQKTSTGAKRPARNRIQMNALFGNKKKPGFQPQKPKIRVEKITAAPKPQPLPSAVIKKSGSSKNSHSSAALQPQKTSLHNVPVRSLTSSAQSSRAGSSDNSDSLKVRKRKATRQISPVHQRLESDSEDDGKGTLEFGGYGGTENKRRRDVDRNRKLGCKELADKDAVMTHQADIEIAEFAKGGVPEDAVRLKFQYPNAVQLERYA